MNYRLKVIKTILVGIQTGHLNCKEIFIQGVPNVTDTNGMVGFLDQSEDDFTYITSHVEALLASYSRLKRGTLC